MALLGDYDWPGNVRELANLCERLSALQEGDRAGAGEVAALLDRSPGLPSRGSAGSEAAPRWNLREMEREALLSAVEEAGGNFSLAARSLGISRSTLWRKWKTLRS